MSMDCEGVEPLHDRKVMAPLKQRQPRTPGRQALAALHDRKVMAPLKRHGQARRTTRLPTLHDRKVMAPLKRFPAWSSCPWADGAALHDRKVMAPLKLAR